MTAVSGTGLSVAFGPTQVLSDVSIAVQPGEVVAVMGPSGSGKSTLLHVLAGLLAPDQGEVHLGEQRIDRLSERRRSALRLSQVGFVFQFGDLVPELSLVENVELPLTLTGTPRRSARRTALDLLGHLGVADVADRRVPEVSGGQAQRAAVGRALVHQPRVVFADEPTGALDTVTGEIVLEALVDTARDQQAAVLLVTHETRVASYAERLVSLRDGRLSEPVLLP